MMFLGGVVRAVGPDHEVQEAGILLWCVGMVVVTDTMYLQGPRVLRKRRVEIAMRGCGLYPKDFSEVNKMRQSKPDEPSFEKERSTRNVATAENEYMSNAKGHEVNELAVVEIKKFIWRKLTSRTQQPSGSGNFRKMTHCLICQICLVPGT